MFIDYAKITVKAGDGGHGIIAFRREKYVPKGGPNGGDGGKGGDVTLKVDPQLATLQDVHYNRIYKAKRGKHGSGSNKHGANGESIVVPVPPGTIVKAADSHELLVDLTKPGQTFTAAKGGAGGFGNAHFKSPRHQSPNKATDGRPGEERELELELKVLADVGLVGFPNAGKSTLLSRLSKAHPKIADYPFTTVEPHLGIVKAGEYRSFVMADIPGLIEGASKGKGMGIQFLRHIERTRLLLFLIDATLEEPIDEQLQVLQDELKTYAPYLAERMSLVILTKKDAWAEVPDSKLLEAKGLQIIGISAVSGDGLEELVQIIDQELEARKLENEAGSP
jgi:GTP-binding protein